MTFSDAIFWAFAVSAVVPALGVLVSPKIVHMAFWLLFSLAGFAGLYLQLGAGFLGFAQVVVYIGGILILFLFGVMLTQKQDVPVREKWRLTLLVPGVVSGLAIMSCLVFTAAGMPWKENVPQAAASAGTQRLGLELMSTYILPFEVVSVLLLVAMVGAAYIARSREEGQEGSSGGEP